MEYKLDGDELTIFLSGRIYSDKASAIEKEVKTCLACAPHKMLIVDLESLEYISSAGLRIILNIKKVEPSMQIVNVQRDVYDIFEMTGFTQMMPVARAFRKISVDGCEIIGKGAVGTVYRYLDGTIVKVYQKDTILKKIYSEKNKAQRAFTLGIPTAISFDVVKVGDAYGTVYEMIDARMMSSLIKEQPEKIGEYAKVFSDVLKMIHNSLVAEGDLPTAREIFVNPMLSYLKGNVSDDTKKHIVKLFNDVPPCQNVIHGDYHTNNLLIQNGEPILIDMDKLCCGNKIFELGCIYSTFVLFGRLHPNYVSEFIGFDYVTASKFYDLFLDEYLHDVPKEMRGDIRKKIELVGNLRHLRHAVNKIQGEDEKRKVMNMCIDELERLSKYVDNLTW